MKRIVIFGNSGSGKSTLADSYARDPHVHHLDLDEIAWKAPGIRKEIEESIAELRSFLSDNEEWVIEGCYGSLISEAARAAKELIFLNPGVDVCQDNCKSRPWEPHKYATKEEQDANLDMLLEWVADYQTRTDEFSLSAHRKIFNAYGGKKRELKSNSEMRNKASKAQLG